MIRAKIEELMLHAKVEGKVSPRSDGRGDNLVFTPCGKALVAAILQAIRDEVEGLRKDVESDDLLTSVSKGERDFGFNEAIDQIKEKLK
jgi:hypothetical protein